MALPLVHEPGEKWTYGASTKVLGDVVATLSGQPIDAFLESRIFRPLGMPGRSHTGDFRVRLQPVANTDLSKPYPLGVGEDVWGLGFQLAAPAEPDPGMRRPGSMSWAGINNTFYWIDPQAEIG